MKSKLIYFFLAISTILCGQSSGDRINLFIDCQMRCDFTFIRQEILFVNYMQNRQEADIYVLATRQRTGAGGREVQLVFIGENQFSTLRDTLIYFTDPNATDAIEREQMVKELKTGLLPFLVHSNLASQITYTVENMENTTDTATQKDPWDYWVFNVGGNTFFNAESSFKNIDLTGRVHISRVTDQHKFVLSSRYSFEKSTFELADNEKVVSIKKRFNIYSEYVKSLGPHWSAGATSRVRSSTFNNTDFSATFKPAVEYNIFPYDDASTRRFSLQYSVGPDYYQYTDTTIYNKLSETVVQQALFVQFEQTQKWGNIELDIGFNQYFHDLELYSMFFNPELEWVIFKGFSLDFGGYVSLVNDRISISKEEFTDEEILLQIKQLDTEFTYFFYGGINYRFGSKFNNFVNQRF